MLIRNGLKKEIQIIKALMKNRSNILSAYLNKVTRGPDIYKNVNLSLWYRILNYKSTYASRKFSSFIHEWTF